MVSSNARLWHLSETPPAVLDSRLWFKTGLSRGLEPNDLSFISQY